MEKKTNKNIVIYNWAVFFPVVPDADSSCGLHHSGEMQLLLEWKLNGKRLTKQ